MYVVVYYICVKVIAPFLYRCIAKRTINTTKNKVASIEKCIYIYKIIEMSETDYIHNPYIVYINNIPI